MRRGRLGISAVLPEADAMRGQGAIRIDRSSFLTISQPSHSRLSQSVRRQSIPAVMQLHRDGRWICAKKKRAKGGGGCNDRDVRIS